MKPVDGPLGIRSRIAAASAGALAIAAAAIVVAPLIGSTHISVARAFDWSVPWATNVDAQIFFVARLPRVLAAALVGSALAASGVILQALLRNPLATPFTLGVSAGAALGAMLVLVLGGAMASLSWASVPAASFVGALAAVGVVYLLAAGRHRGFSTGVLLLAGVTLNSFLSALILLVQYFADMTQTMQTLRWLLGDLDVAGYRPLVAALPMLVIAYVVFLVLAPSLNLLSLGTDLAAARGVDVVRVERVAFLTASLATGAAVSIAGPIGFIGIVVPHLVRMVVGSRSRASCRPRSVRRGRSSSAAISSRACVIAPIDLPVGIVTARSAVRSSSGSWFANHDVPF